VISLDFDFSSLNAKLDEITLAAEEGVRPAAQAGAQVFYDEMRARVPVSAKTHHTKSKKQTFDPGNLRAAIYQAFVEKESNEARAVYRISVNKDKAFYWVFLELGTSRMPARPFIRPTYDGAEQKALDAARENLFEHIRKVLQ
jgi:HK97 gp10 family phage protein